MAVLKAASRDNLDDSDFAYIDSAGGRHLPIHDAAHVRAAMARFNQTAFESASAKTKAHGKIVAAAKRFGIEVSSFDDDGTVAVEADLARFDTTTGDGGTVIRRGKIFECGDYPDKAFTFDETDLERAIETFEPVDLDLEHMPTVLDGQLGMLRSIAPGPDGASLYGEVHLPAWLDALLADGERKVSATWDRATKQLRGLALVRNPRVSDAALMAAFAADRSRHPTGKYAREDTRSGQVAMQQIHDIAAQYGAKQRGKRAMMASTHEARGFQSIHDTASTHGADHNDLCSADMSIDDQPRRRARMNLKEFLTGKAADDGVQLDDLDTALEPPDTAEFAAALKKRDDELAALKAQNERQAAQFAQLASERRQAEAATFAQSAVAAHRVPPAAVETLAALAVSIALREEAVTFAEGEKGGMTLLTELVNALPDLTVFTTSALAPGQAAMALPNTTKTVGTDELADEKIAALMAATPLGKAILADKNGQQKG